MEQPWLIPAILTLVVTAVFAGAALSADKPKTVRQWYHPVKLTQLIPLLVLIAVYTPVAFWQLGSTDTPESFGTFKQGSLTLLLPDDGNVPGNLQFAYYCGIGTGEYYVETSTDGVNWQPFTTWQQDYIAILKWHVAEPFYGANSIHMVRISASDSNMELGEVALFDESGHNYLFAYDKNSEPLVDEPNCPINDKDWMYNSYFDEIYHPRTALEHMKQISPFEISHPPLGKIILSVGMRLFGVNPFGWRFMGTLIGVLMLIPLYIFIQNMFGKPIISVCATALFTFDFMHYVQTRIATIDTEAVFFIILMYYFMYRWFVMAPETPTRKALPWIILSGVAFGLGAASKWIVIYGGIGLAILWVIKLIQIIRTKAFAFNTLKAPEPAQAEQGGKKRTPKKAPTSNGAQNRKIIISDTILYSVVFFAIVPIIIYLLSYIPYAQAGYGAYGQSHTLGGYLKMVWENQTSMLHYHSGLNATHPYSSQWWKWLIDIRPILYFQWFRNDGTKSVFGAFTNPLLTWAGLFAMIMMFVYSFKRKDKLAQIISVGYLLQLLPWVGIQRIAFAYHYFPDIVFLTLAVAYLMNDIVTTMTRSHDGEPSGAIKLKSVSAGAFVAVFTLCAIALFVLFFPALSGKPMTDEYSHWLQWFRSYPF